MDAVNGAERQGRPAELPGATRGIGAVERQETFAWTEAALAKMISGGEAGLPGTDHEDIDLSSHPDECRGRRGFQCDGQETAPTLIQGLAANCCQHLVMH